ncbi:MAG: hypothetical protein IAE97_04270 [Chthoniobacterales bacterium]|nr:hypothetical protein [Chthoniobacterales bacterium]
MTRIFIAIALCSAGLKAAIPINETAAHMGETMVVKGMVAQVSTTGSGMTFLNFGKPHPDSEFTAVVKPGSGDFGDLSVFQGKEVDVEGVIESHKGKPQIVLSHPSNIRLAGAVSSMDGLAAPRQTTADQPSLTPQEPDPPSSATDEGDEDSNNRSLGRSGTMEEFQVPLTADEKKLAGRSPGGAKPEDATVGLMLPEGFDPSKPQKVLVVFSTDDNGGAHLKAMPRFGGVATRNGWVAIAATGPVLENNLPAAWHAAMIYAGLRALEEKYPGAKNWRYFVGGNSGGGLRSSMMACALLKQGYPVEGVFMGGSGDERFTAGMAIFKPIRSSVRDLAVYLAIGKNDPMIDAARADYVAAAVKKLGIKNIRRDSYDGAHGMDEASLTKALEWFADGAK